MTNRIDRFDHNGPYAFLSNYAEAVVTLDGVEYPTVEHAYHAAKSFDKDHRLRVASALTPGMAKKLGQSVTLRSDWETVKLDVMEGLLRQKFSHIKLILALLATGDADLIEGNWWHDTFWGVSFTSGEGENHLGKLLMKIREECRAKILDGDFNWIRG